MITKETERCCLFCASDYHLEMLILPYICNKIEKEKFVIITQKNLEDSIKLVLDRINIKKDIKEKIWNLGWNEKEKIYNCENELIKKETEILKEGENKNIVNFVINGDYSYIMEKNKMIKEKFKNNNIEINIIDCFHIEDKDVDIEKISKNYGKIINTIKI